MQIDKKVLSEPCVLIQTPNFNDTMINTCSLEVFLSVHHESDAELELNLVLRGVHVCSVPGAPFPVHVALLTSHRKVNFEGCNADPSIRVNMHGEGRLHHTVLVILHCRMLAVVFLSKAPLHVDLLEEPVGGTNEKHELLPTGKNLLSCLLV